ncbi:uncharacterized protein LOC116293393 [Actinia tenebrosa]|uniref:Uncharacterized protein LOC116293393 n=1 Tax=Actinia tenebrosa TaxID=6105 RepID=A0A6P8HLQ3_ACTTE|nr:uncharacterized protein LOC116293393 [Actinia tenebrosa]
MLRSQSHEVTALDSTITALVYKCKNSSSELEKSLVKLKAVSEMTSLLNIKCPPEAPITLGWMKTNLESVSQEISSHKSRKIQAVSSVTTKKESLKSHTNALKALIVTHQQLVSEVKALLTTMVKDEDGHESSTAAKSFITSYNRLSDESAQLIKSTLSCKTLIPTLTLFTISNMMHCGLA